MSRRLAYVLTVLVAGGVVSGAVGESSAPQRGAPPGSPSAGAPTQGTSAISGVVIDATTERPVSGAVVTIASPGAVLASATRQVTDESGRFVFTYLPAADSYVIRAQKTGYLDGGYGRETYRSPNRPVALANAQWLGDATVKLWRTGAITGIVTDETGEPIVGVLVTVVPQILIGGEAQWVSGSVARTDDRGVYRITSLTPGRYRVMVPSIQTAVPAEATWADISGRTAQQVAMGEVFGVRPIAEDAVLAGDGRYRLIAREGVVPFPPRSEGRPQAYPSTFHPESRSLTDGAVIDLGPGEERFNVNVEMRPLPVSRLSGVVEGPAEALAGLSLRLMSEGAENMAAGHETATALVGANGAFTFLNVPDGRYTILARRGVSGYAYNAMSGTRLPQPPGRYQGESASAVLAAPAGTMLWTFMQSGFAEYSGRATVEIAGVDRSNVVVRLERGVTISGRLVFEKPPDPNSRATASGSLELRAEPAGGEPSLGQPRGRIDLNDPTLRFRIDGVTPGEYLLRFFGGGTGILKSVVWDGKDFTYTPLRVSAGEDVSGVVVTTTTESGRLEGVVRDAQERPLSQAAVICFPTEAAQWRRYGVQPTRLRSVAVSTIGAYRMASLPAGSYYVVAVSDGLADGWKDPAFLAAAAPLATRITIAWGEVKQQDLTVVAMR